MQKIVFSHKSFSMWIIIFGGDLFQGFESFTIQEPALTSYILLCIAPGFNKDKATKTEFEPIRVQVSATTFVSSN